MPDWFDSVFTAGKVFLSLKEKLLFIECMSNKVHAQKPNTSTHAAKQSLLSAVYQTLNHIQEVWIRLNRLMEQECESLNAAQTTQV